MKTQGGKNMNKKKIGLTIMGCALAVGIVGCSQTKDANVTEKKEITFATAPDTQPFTYKKDGKLTGFDVELVNALAKGADLKVKWQESKFNGIIPALQSKSIDGGVSAITIRDDRKQVTDFTDTYYESGLVLVTKKGSTITKPEDLKGKTIVAKQGSAGLTKAKELGEKYGAKVNILEDEATLYLNVQKGGADALINDLPFVQTKLKAKEFSDLQIAGDKLSVDEYGIAIAKDEKELLKTFNKELKEMKENGEYDKLYQKYFGE